MNIDLEDLTLEQILALARTRATKNDDPRSPFYNNPVGQNILYRNGIAEGGPEILGSRIIFPGIDSERRGQTAHVHSRISSSASTIPAVTPAKNNMSTSGIQKRNRVGIPNDDTSSKRSKRVNRDGLKDILLINLVAPEFVPDKIIVDDSGRICDVDIGAYKNNGRYSVRFSDYMHGAIEWAFLDNKANFSRKYLAETFPMAFTETGHPRKNHLHEGAPFIDPDGAAIEFDDQVWNGGDTTLQRGQLVTALRGCFSNKVITSWANQIFGLEDEEDDISENAQAQLSKEQNYFEETNLFGEKAISDKGKTKEELQREIVTLQAENLELKYRAETAEGKLIISDNGIRKLLHDTVSWHKKVSITTALSALEFARVTESVAPNTGILFVNAMRDSMIEISDRLHQSLPDLREDTAGAYTTTQDIDFSYEVAKAQNFPGFFADLPKKKKAPNKG